MDLNLVKISTLTVLSKISDNDLNSVTLPVLRGKVAETMKLPIEELLGKEIKRVILETFQEFILSKTDGTIVESESKEQKEQEVTIPIPNEPTIKKKTKESDKKDTEIVIVYEKSTNSKEKVVGKDGDNSSNKTGKKVSSKTTGKTTNKSRAEETGKPSTPSKSVPSTKSLQIEKLKSYVFKCGVRKVWKKELEGLNENQSVAKIQGILRELGIEGKPSLEQCKAIKSRREFEAELREIDTSNIIEGKRRNRGSEIGVKSDIKMKLVASEDEDEEVGGSGDSEIAKSFTVDLKNFGDSESD